MGRGEREGGERERVRERVYWAFFFFKEAGVGGGGGVEAEYVY